MYTYSFRSCHSYSFYTPKLFEIIFHFFFIKSMRYVPYIDYSSSYWFSWFELFTFRFY